MAKYADLEDMPIEEWLGGCVPIDITEEAINNILFERGIEPETTLDETTKRQRELCKADVFMWCSAIPSQTGTVKDADGGWSHSEGGNRMTEAEKRALRKRAYAIYKLYGERIPGMSSVRVNNMGMRIM